jgi:NADH-quinone oxidoreductase subunit L
MVTAGVYLIARTHVLFSHAPAAQLAVGIVGAITMTLAGFSALAQHDIKRILAYSTVSQIGYMFLALGVGAWQAAMFHFLTHACFKALLFLGAGAVIEALHHEHSIFKMGGLRHGMPVVFWTFLIGGCALAGLPLVTAGFFSKDLIIWNLWSSPQGHPAFWVAAIAGALVTSLYTFRLIFRVFFGPAHTAVVKRPGYAMLVPLCVLAVLSIGTGYLKEPVLGFLSSALPFLAESHAGRLTEFWSASIAASAFAIGLGLAYLFHLKHPKLADAVVTTSLGSLLQRWSFDGWGFDSLYAALFVRPYIWVSQVNKNDFIDAFYVGFAQVADMCCRALSLTETGRFRWYAAAMAGGSALFLGLVLFL